MKYSLEELYEMLDEELLRRESETDEKQKGSTYHEGWVDALRWLLDILAPQIYHTPREVDDETW